MAATLERVETVPPAERIFEDKEFRNWVNEVGLVAPVAGIEAVELPIKMGMHFTYTEEAFLNTLTTEENRGHIIPWKMFMNGFISEDPVGYISTNIFRIRAKIGDSSLLNHIYKLGLGFGIEDHSFKPTETARLIYILWQNFDKEIPNRSLADSLYGAKKGTPYRRLDYLRVTASRFNNSRLKSARVKLEHPKSHKKLTWV